MGKARTLENERCRQVINQMMSYAILSGSFPKENSTLYALSVKPPRAPERPFNFFFIILGGKVREIHRGLEKNRCSAGQHTVNVSAKVTQTLSSHNALKREKSSSCNDEKQWTKAQSIAARYWVPPTCQRSAIKYLAPYGG